MNTLSMPTKAKSGETKKTPREISFEAARQALAQHGDDWSKVHAAEVARGDDGVIIIEKPKSGT